MNNRPQVLIVTPTFPYPIDAGGRVAQFYILEYLRDYFDITLLSLQLDNPHLEAFKKACPGIKVEVVPKDIWLTLNKAKLKLKYKTENLLATKKVSHLFIERTSGFQHYNSRVLDFLKTFDFSKFDLVQFDFIESSAYLSKLKINVPTILVHHEIRFIRCEREMDIIGTSENRQALNAKLQSIKQTEISAMEAFDNVVVFSEVDKSKLESLNIKPSIYSTPFGSKIDTSKSKEPYQFQNKVVYLGGEKHFPNRDAVEWFVDLIWPSVVEKNLDCKFLITGNWSAETKQIIASKHSNIEFTGMVDNIAEVLEGSILAVPLRIGSGIRTKIFEAFALKIPVVSTSIGIEGIPAENQTHCLIQDDPNIFAENLNEMISNIDALPRMIQNAFELYNSNYTQEACGELRLNIMNKIIATKPTLKV